MLWMEGGARSAAAGLVAGPSAARLQKRNRSAQDDRVWDAQRDQGLATVGRVCAAGGVHVEEGGRKARGVAVAVGGVGLGAGLGELGAAGGLGVLPGDEWATGA